MHYFKKNRKVILFSGFVLLFLVGVGFAQIIVKQLAPFEDQPVVSVEQGDQNKTSLNDQEVLVKPVDKSVSVTRGYYESTLSKSDIEKALVYFEGVYRPHYGLDYTCQGKVFSIKAATSGQVIQKEKDSLLGWCITIKHQSGLETIYESLDDVKVEKGQNVKQNAVIASSGQNVYESDLGSHLHFLIRKNETSLNPSSFYNKEITKIMK